MNLDELKALEHCRVVLGLKRINQRNPYEVDSDGARKIQMALELHHPLIAARLRGQSEPLSVTAALALKGEVELTEEVHQELLSTVPQYREQAEAKQRQWEQDQLARMEAAADQLQRRRGHDPAAAKRPRNAMEAAVQAQQQLTAAGL